MIFLNDTLGSEYNLDAILRDFKQITDHKNANAMIKYEETESNHLCALENCYILQRNYRDRSHEDSNDKTVKTLYFIDENKDKNDSNITDISTQELMDSIHCFMDHTLRISQTEIENETKKQISEVKSENKSENDSFDMNLNAICDLMHRKQTINPRLRNINRFQSGENKFMTSATKGRNERRESETENKSDLAVYQSLVYEQKQKTEKGDICLLGAVLTEICEVLSEERQSQTALTELAQFLSEEEFDTDSLSEDVSNAKQSNIYHRLVSINERKSVKSVYQICQSFLKECNNKMDIYSNGFRFWYWPFYKNNISESNVVFKGGQGTALLESNPGYLLSDWFIACIYGDLKEECLHNMTAPFSMYQWNVTYKKAMMKLQSWQSDPKARELLSQTSLKRSWAEKFYGIKQETPILLQHIIAILLYCNFTHQSYEFSRTYRKIHALESDRSLKKRHSQFSIWGKRLRELIECYGLRMSQTKDIKVYYHGVNSEMIFKSTTVKLNGPVSTTLGMSYIY